MSFSANQARTLFLVAVALAVTSPSVAAAATDTTAIADTIRHDVAQIVAGLNAHDAARTTAYDAANIVAIECGSPRAIGSRVDREGFETGFAHDPGWKVTLIDETVDVAGSGDLAVYRGAYNEDHSSAGGLMTHKTDFIAEFKRHRDGSWKMEWYAVVRMEQSHQKRGQN